MKHLSKFLSVLISALFIIEFFTGCQNPSSSTTSNVPAPPGSYKIIFDSNGGNEISSQIIKENEYITKPDNPVKKGYTFAEWYDGDTEFDFDTPVTDEITLTAHWTANTYTVVFNTDGKTSGTNPSSISCTYDTEFTLPKANIRKTNSSFAGWALTSDAENAKYADGVTLKNLTAENNATVTLYAVWYDCYYTIRFWFENFKVGSYTEKTEYRKIMPANPGQDLYWQNITGDWQYQKSIFASLPDSAMVGFSQNHDKTNAESENLKVNSDCSTILNIYLKRSSYTVQYSSLNSTKTSKNKLGNPTMEETLPETKTYRWGETVTVDFNSSLTFHHLLGYKEKLYGGTVSEDIVYKKGGKTTFTMSKNDVYLYAYWELDTRTVTFVPNGGTQPEKQVVNYYSCASSPADCTKDNYTLSCWCIDENCTQKYDFTTPVTEDITLYAKWMNSTATADTILDTINSMSETSTIKLVGEITEDLLTQICSAVNKLPKDVYLNLDMSGATGVTKFESSSLSSSEYYKKQFYYCKKLKSIILPSCLTTLGDMAFLGCNALESVVIPDSVTTIDCGAFDSCNAFTELNIPKSVTSINGHFSKFSYINKITVDSENPNFTSVDGVLYSKDKKTLVLVPVKITEFTIPLTVETIGEYAFGYSSIKTVIIPSSVTEIEHFAFSNSKLESITIPGTVTSIGNYAFSDCAKLAEVTIENGVKVLSKNMFIKCKSLETITIPDSVEKIGADCFYYCTSLKAIHIPNSVKKIDTGVFKQCTALKTVTFNDSENWYVGDPYSTSYNAWNEADKVNPDDLKNVSEWISSSGKFYKYPLYHKN